MAKAKPKKGQHLKSPTIRGNAPSKLEYEARLRIVERCISVGISSDTAILMELKKQGRSVAIRTVREYTSLVRKRLQKEDEELRALRKNILIRDCQKYEKVIFGKLMEGDISPRWYDLVNLLKIRQSVEAGKFEDLPPAPIVEAETVDEFERIDEAEADRRLNALLDQVELPVPTSETKH